MREVKRSPRCEIPAHLTALPFRALFGMSNLLSIRELQKVSLL
jgi:hypothetical protein